MQKTLQSSFYSLPSVNYPSRILKQLKKYEESKINDIVSKISTISNYKINNSAVLGRLENFCYSRALNVLKQVTIVIGFKSVKCELGSHAEGFVESNISLHFVDIEHPNSFSCCNLIFFLPFSQSTKGNRANVLLRFQQNLNN